MKAMVIYIITGIKIENEILKENILEMDSLGNLNLKEYTYNKINGVKYYYDDDVTIDKWFSIKNNERTYTSERFKRSSDAAIRYYREALEFKGRLNGYGLNDLTPAAAVDESGNKISSDNGWRKL